jgi:ATP-dependent DNA ligase
METTDRDWIMAKKQLIAASPIKTQQPHPDYERFVKQANFQDYIWQIKHDGVRTLFDPEHLQFYSRNAKVYPNFHIFQDEAVALHAAIARRVGSGMFHLDGEMSGEVFASVMEQLFRESDVDMSGLLYHVFDFTCPGLTWIERHLLLVHAFQEVRPKLLRLVPAETCPHFDSVEDLEAFVKKLNDRGYEGCVFKRRDGHYLFGKKAANEWVKGVLDETLDLVVSHVVEGKGKLKGCVGAFVCALPGAPNGVVEVAPGRATHDQLRHWWEKPEERPLMIEVLFKSKTKDGSLRHPRFKRSRWDK